MKTNLFQRLYSFRLPCIATLTVAAGTSCAVARKSVSAPDLPFALYTYTYKGESFVCSPWSLSTAMAMAREGASGATYEELAAVCGGEPLWEAFADCDGETPDATDSEVRLRAANAVVVNECYPLLPGYRTTVETNYGASVNVMDFCAPEEVADRVNGWCERQTEGLVRDLLDPKDITPSTATLLMNALYFQGAWEGSDYRPMFLTDNTKTEDFHLSDGSTCRVEMMYNKEEHRYAELDGFRVLALPYAGEQYFFYVLLPDENDLPGLIDRLQTMTWTSVLGQLKQDADVYVRLPKFSLENKFDLSEVLMKLGVKRAFQPDQAEFDRMFVPQDGVGFCISKVIQGAKIAVTEQGTEAGAVTIVQMMATSAFPGFECKQVHFYADHPFLFLLGDLQGNVLFQGAFVGEK